MPYDSVDQVPSYVPKSKKRQWMAVWNAAYKEYGDESRAFATANAAIKDKSQKLYKFGTLNTGYTSAEYGPFECGRCKYSDTLVDESICINEHVLEDEDVPEDSYGNKIIEEHACCCLWAPIDEE